MKAAFSLSFQDLFQGFESKIFLVIILSLKFKQVFVLLKLEGYLVLYVIIMFYNALDYGLNYIFYFISWLL